jgi:MOSC domain-containing protein YiiM
MPDKSLAMAPAASENQTVEHLSPERLMAGLGHIRDAPSDGGRLVLIVRRPVVGERELPREAMLDQAVGLVGDNWLTRGSKSTPDGSADPERQVTVMNARAAELVAGGTDRMHMAGDQLYVDLDLSLANLPAGSLLAIGEAVLRVSEAPHLGCEKFVARFGTEAMRFVNGRIGRHLRLRGMNARVVVPGTIRVGDLAAKTMLARTGTRAAPATAH